MENIIIAIDGPAGAGKGEITKQIAKKYNLLNIGSGSFYRAYTYYLIKSLGYDNLKQILNESLNNLSYSNLKDFESGFNIVYENDNLQEKIIVNGIDISNEIRTMQVNSLVSYVSEIIPIRKFLNKKFRENKDKNIIMEGRDIATCVFPDATIKIYLTADLEIRAKRRYLQNIQNNIDTSFQECLLNLKTRDEIDYNKPYGKLELNDQYILVDNTNKTIEQTIECISKIIDEKLKEKK